MPEEMGEAFKAMALTRDLEIPPPGFALQDLRQKLLRRHEERILVE